MEPSSRPSKVLRAGNLEQGEGTSWMIYSLDRTQRVVVVYLTFTDPLRIQPWSQDRRNQTKSKREHVRRKTGKKAGKADIIERTRKQPANDIVARKEHRRDRIKN